MNENEQRVEDVIPTPMPLSSVDDAAPLMLDLPDGQQLVIGKLPDGIVIEIATWRGTGRPDSRTNRLMLGVSFDEEIQDQNIAGERVAREGKFVKPKFLDFKRKSETPEETPQIIDEIAPVEAIEEVVPVEAIEEVAPVEVEIQAIDVDLDVEPVEPLVESELEPALESLVNEEEVVQADEVVEVVTEAATFTEIEPPTAMRVPLGADIFGARPRTQVDFPGNTLTPTRLDRGHEIVKKRKKIAMPPLGKVATATLKYFSPIVALFVICAALGVSLVHPSEGLKTTLSSAKGSLAVVKSADSYAVGDNVVATSDGTEKKEVFGSIAARSDKDFIITANDLYYTVHAQDVHGRVLLVMPGLGYLAGLIGF